METSKITMIDFMRRADGGRFAHILDIEAYRQPLDHQLTVEEIQQVLSNEDEWQRHYLEFLPKHPLGTASNHYLMTLLFIRYFQDPSWVQRELAGMKPVIAPKKKTYAEALRGNKK